MKSLVKSNIIILFLLNHMFHFSLHAEEKSETIKKIQSNNAFIHSAACRFDISENCLKAVIYTERTMNFDWKDTALDDILARSGLNSSIGFCQVKLKTAYWIENQLSSEKSEFYPGRKYSGILKISKSPEEIIKKLNMDSLNILYAAAYIRIIQSRWQKMKFPLDKYPEITGTLYSTGLYHSDGKERLPNSNAKPNLFGMNVKKAFLDLFKSDKYPE